MSRPPLALLLAKGWKSVPPRDIGHELIWQSQQILKFAKTDFESIDALGDIGHIDCPIAVDSARRIAYRYACPNGRLRQDYSEIRSYDLNTGKIDTVFSLGLNKWIVWLFHLVADGSGLMGLVATDMPGAGVNIQHQLGIFDLQKKKSLLVSLPRDSFFPLALCSRRNEILFYGVEGYQRIDFKGKRLSLLQGSELPPGRGASYHPSEPLIALGGREILIWNYVENRFERIHDRGQNPVWDVSGEGLWFSETSGDLFYYDRRTKAKTRIAAVGGNPLPEVNYAKPVKQTADGRYLSLPLTRKIKRKIAEHEAADNRSLYYYVHALCVLDTETQEVWQYSDSVMNWEWVV